MSVHAQAQRSRGKDAWETPRDVFRTVCQLYCLNPKVDVAATYGNHKCAKFFTDSLDKKWSYPWFCNPPFNLKEEFVRKADEEFRRAGHDGIMLLPNIITERDWFHDIILNADGTGFNDGIEVYFHKKRIRFLDDGVEGCQPVSGTIWIVWSKRPLKERKKNYKWEDPMI